MFASTVLRLGSSSGIHISKISAHNLTQSYQQTALLCGGNHTAFQQISRTFAKEKAKKKAPEKEVKKKKRIISKRPEGRIGKPWERSPEVQQKLQKLKEERIANAKPEDIIWEKLTEPTMSFLPGIPRISREELEILIKNQDRSWIVVDLRDNNPSQDRGEPMIPSAHNLPLPRVSSPNKKENTEKNKKEKKEEKEEMSPDEVFKKSLEELNDEQWTQKFKFSKLKKSDKIIFYSSSGKRSDLITKTALELGFSTVKSLSGGSRLWAKFNTNNINLAIINSTSISNLVNLTIQ